MLNILLTFIFLHGFYSSTPCPSDQREVPPSPKITLNYIEYNRGIFFPTTAQIGLSYPGHFNLTFHDVPMHGRSFYPDRIFIPNAFIWLLLEGKPVKSLEAFTEPYYGVRAYHFFKKNPNLGIGFEFVHLKVFLKDEGEVVHISGEDSNGGVDEWKSTTEYISNYNVSHGVNHLSLSLVYRLMLFPSDKVPAGRLQPYSSLSFGPCIPHPQLRIMGDPAYKAYSYQPGFKNFGFGINLGMRLQISGKFGFYFEYKFTKSFLNEMSFDNGEKGKFWSRFPAHHLAWGISFIL
jgi:hypothetical protein